MVLLPTHYPGLREQSQELVRSIAKGQMAGVLQGVAVAVRYVSRFLGADMQWYPPSSLPQSYIAYGIA
jgi:hypothetical protein